MEIFWFKNNHEARNDILRFGLMRLHRTGSLRYREFPLQECVRFGFGKELARHEHRHTSLILVRNRKYSIRCLVDSEDSFFWMCPLISEVDCYFCAGYNTEFFQHRRLFAPYPWQTSQDVHFYQDRAAELILKFGRYFERVRKFVPIAPSMSSTQSISLIAQRFRNLKHKSHAAFSGNIYWKSDLQDYERRYSDLLRLRNQPLLYDVVLLDTLWGWPKHRFNLHSKLKSLNERYRIHSRLNWSDPVPFDGSASAPLDRAYFPIETGPISQYEVMLASSRLAVYATGFHWGWRSIMSLALMFGLPVYMDKPVLEPWFDLNRFLIFWNDEGEWRDLEKLLNCLPEPEWEKIKAHNQSQYDEVMAPERVAKYFIDTALQ